MYLLMPLSWLKFNCIRIYSDYSLLKPQVSLMSFINTLTIISKKNYVEHSESYYRMNTNLPREENIIPYLGHFVTHTRIFHTPLCKGLVLIILFTSKSFQVISNSCSCLCLVFSSFLAYFEILLDYFRSNFFLLGVWFAKLTEFGCACEGLSLALTSEI